MCTGVGAVGARGGAEGVYGLGTALAGAEVGLVPLPVGVDAVADVDVDVGFAAPAVAARLP